MSRTSVYMSMTLWFALGLVAMWGGWQLVAQAYPDWHVMARLAAGIIAFQMIYGLRSLAREKGWAMRSYAPPAK